jgi:hypothetical protein
MKHETAEPMKPGQAAPLLTAQQVAELLSVSEDTVYRYATRGVRVKGTPVRARLHGLRIGKGWVEFTSWAVNLPVEQYEPLIHLAEHGGVWPADQLPKLEACLARLVEEVISGTADNPGEDGFETLCRVHLLVVNRPDGAEALVVTDGTEGDSED